MFGVKQTAPPAQIFEKDSASLVSIIRHYVTKKKQALAKFLGRQPLFAGSLAASLARHRHQQKCRCADDVQPWTAQPIIIYGAKHKGSDNVGLSFVPSIVLTSLPKERVLPKASTSENKQGKLLSHLRRPQSLA